MIPLYTVRKVILGTLILIPGLILAQSHTWQIIGPEGGPVAALAQNPADPSVLLAASVTYPSSIFRSTDHGATWTYFSGISTRPTKLFYDPANASVVYALNGGMYWRSTDGGQNWAVHSFPTNLYAGDMILDPVDHSIIHAAGQLYDPGSGKWRCVYWKGSVDGTTLAQQFLSAENGYCYAVEVESGNPSHVYAGGYTYSAEAYNGALYVSTNGGTSFSAVSNIQGYTYDIAEDPANPGRVFAVTYSYVYRSSDHGANWTINNGYLPSPQFVQVLDGLVYLGTFYGVYKGDGGPDYSELPGSAPNSGARAFLVERSSPHHTIFFANNGGIIRSTDGGSSWSECCSGLTGGTVTAIRCAPSSPTTLFAAIDQVAVYKSASATASAPIWDRLPDFYACTNVDALAVLPTDPNVIYAMEGGG